MRTHIAISIVALALLAPAAQAAPERSPEINTIAAGCDVKVYYSFDHYANNPKVSRTFIAGDMLQAARGTTALKSSAWDVSGVTDRLTSLLSLHTHSVSTTKAVRKDLERVAAKKAYERIMHSRWDDKELIVFCHRARGKNNIDELLVFKFRSSYCSRVIQMTGRLRTSDIAAILKMTK
mgnify:CR=1 FL=1